MGREAGSLDWKMQLFIARIIQNDWGDFNHTYPGLWAAACAACLNTSEAELDQ